MASLVRHFESEVESLAPAATARFNLFPTTMKSILYVHVLNPSEGQIELPALGLKSKNQPNKIKTIRLIGSDEQVEFRQEDDKLLLRVPANRPNPYAATFEVTGAL